VRTSSAIAAEEMLLPSMTAASRGAMMLTCLGACGVASVKRQADGLHAGSF
jgi:hypothetical protein